MTLVLKTMASARPGDSGSTDLCDPGLGYRLFIDTEHRRMRRRVQVQPDDVGSFLSKSGSFEPCSLRPERLECSLRTRGNHHLRDAQRLAKLARAPLSGAICRLTFLPSTPAPGPPAAGVSTVALGDMPVYSPPIRCSVKRLPSWRQSHGCTRSVRTPHPRCGLQRAARSAVRAARRSARSVGYGLARQFHALRTRQFDCVCHGRKYSLQMTLQSTSGRRSEKCCDALSRGEAYSNSGADQSVDRMTEALTSAFNSASMRNEAYGKDLAAFLDACSFTT